MKEKEFKGSYARRASEELIWVARLIIALAVAALLINF